MGDNNAEHSGVASADNLLLGNVQGVLREVPLARLVASLGKSYLLEPSEVEHVAVEAVQISKNHKRAVAKGGGKSSKKAPVKATSSVVGSGYLRHIHDYYHIEKVVKMRIPLTEESVDNPLVTLSAGKGDPMEKEFTPVFRECFNNGLRLPASAFVNNILAAIDFAPGQLGPFAWGTLTAFQDTISDDVRSTFSTVHTTLGVEESPEVSEGLKKLEEILPPTLALDVFCDPDVLIKAGFSKLVDNFPQFELATLLKAKDGKAVVPHQVSYLDVISGNRFIDQMLVSQLASSAVAPAPVEAISEQLMATEVAYTLSLQLDDSGHRDEEITHLKASYEKALTSTRKERDEAFSKRDEMAELCQRQWSECENLLVGTREASEVYRTEVDRLKDSNREL
ncbi:hypothetical protein LIER_42890 [Lithospermum erythrorhizon]|uniref:Uncharacterized protein n=1 Tax=Lithospermum erythrorhizon TaxID=34254 RepID=A0AAV3P437_LITER